MKGEKFTWDLSPLLSGDRDKRIEAKKREIKREAYKFINKWKDRKDYLEKPEVLKRALDEYERWARNYGAGGSLEYYFYLRTTQEQNNSELKAKQNQISELGKKIENDIQFFAMRLARIPEELQKKFLHSPLLRPYKHFLERLFAQAKYLLSEPEEKIMNLKQDPAYSNWVDMTSNFLSKEERQVYLENGKKAVKPFAELLNLIESRRQKVRDYAAKQLNQVLRKNVDVAEAEINSILMNKKIDDELRKMDRPDLASHVGDDIDTEVVDTLIKVVSDRFDISKRFYTLKAKLMKVKKLKYYERNVEYGKFDKKFSFEDAVELIQKAFSNLDSDFATIFSSFIANRQLDLFPRKGKVDGAFCAQGLQIHPTYILLNYKGNLNNVLTIAHEVGHGINNELIRKKQNALNFNTPISTAEVASTFAEDFVLHEILEESNDELRLSLLMSKLNRDITTIQRQVACYLFEQELHKEFREKGYLSKADIGKLFKKNMYAYMGDAVEYPPGTENWWVYWGHIRAFFYVYSYASGLLISKSLQHTVRKHPEFIEKVKEFLSAGTADSPKNIFRKLGIDITQKSFWSKGLDEIESLLDETEKLAKKLGKI